MPAEPLTPEVKAEMRRISDGWGPEGSDTADALSELDELRERLQVAEGLIRRLKPQWKEQGYWCWEFTGFLAAEALSDVESDFLSSLSEGHSGERTG